MPAPGLPWHRRAKSEWRAVALLAPCLSACGGVVDRNAAADSGGGAAAHTGGAAASGSDGSAAGGAGTSGALATAGSQATDGNGGGGTAPSLGGTSAVAGSGAVVGVGGAGVAGEAPCDPNDPECTPSICGNAVVDPGEECDDGNTESGDGCSGGCRTEVWPICVPPELCQPVIVCGDGELEAAETCDDGNVTAGDGCSPECQVEAGWACPQPARPCVRVPPDACGNGVVEEEYGEQCDDGVNDGGYGECAPGCVIGPYCGDGVLHAPFEQCDDGNNVCCDGCSAACLDELLP